MTVYSYSRLGMYQECPLKYKLRYRDRIKRDTEGIEGFLGTIVHKTLKKCYDDARLTKVNTLPDLLADYDNIWHHSWHDSVLITRQGLTREHYQALGRQLIETYSERYAPFDSDRTIATEMRISFPLDDNGTYKMTGFIDRLSRTRDGAYQIHDYKTSANLPSQKDADSDRQLGLYQIGIQRRWPDIKDARLIWHYLAFDRELVSSRSEEQISRLVGDTIRLIDRIESAEDFPPSESGLCDWCEYPDLCPQRKHLYVVQALPINEYLAEPGVTLVDRYAELKARASDIERDLALVKEALLDYARREQMKVIKGSDHTVRVKSVERLKFPGKNEAERSELDAIVKESGKWLEVSELDTRALAGVIEANCWSKALIDEVLKYGRIEEATSIYLSSEAKQGIQE